MYISQVEGNQFVAVEVYKGVEDKTYKEEEEKESLTEEHDKYISNINLECEEYRKKQQYLMMEVERKRWPFMKTKMKELKQLLKNGVKKR